MSLRHIAIGKAARLYWRVFQPRTLGVRCVLLDPEGRVALVRHIGGTQWYLPGGGVNKGEGFSDALARELAEEVAVTGFAVERVLGAYHSRTEGKDDHIVVFVARMEPRPLVAADVAEIAQAEWFAVDALPKEVSPATRRRLAELRSGTAGTGTW